MTSPGTVPGPSVVDYDEDAAHSALHPWYFAGCDDCDDRADAKEARR